MRRKIGIQVIGLLWAGWIGTGPVAAVECDCSLDSTSLRSGTAWILERLREPRHYLHRELRHPYQHAGAATDLHSGTGGGAFGRTGWVDPAGDGFGSAATVEEALAAELPQVVVDVAE